MAGRHGPALFELIRGSGSTPAPAAAPRPALTPEVRPPPLPQPKAAEPRPEASEPATWSRRAPIFDSGRAITIRMSTVLYIVAGLIVLVIVTWAVAYKLGHGGGESQAVKDLGLNGNIKEPGSIPVNPNLVNNELKAPEPKAVQPEKKPNPPVTPPATPGTDPRTSGLNYYVLASGLTDKDAAQKLADFLTENGLPSSAVLDRKAWASNNPNSFVVFVGRGITPEEFKSRAATRLDVETQVVRLAKVWKQDRKGKIEVTQAYWKHFSNKASPEG